MPTTNFTSGSLIIPTWLNEVDEHVFDQATTAHASDNISFAQSGTGASTRDVQTRLRETFSVKDYGAVGDGSTDDTTAITNAIAAIPSTGGALYFPTGTYKVTSTITITGKAVSIYGDGSGQDIGTTEGSYIKFFSLGTSNGIVFDDADGGFVRDIAIVADTATRPTGGYLVVYQGTSAGFYHSTWSNVTVAGGYNGTLFKEGFNFKAYSCIWKTFNGSQVLMLNGSADVDDVQACEFTNCTIAADGSTTTNLAVLDGYATSTKFVACAMLFGNHGLWLKDSYGSSQDPGFTYFIGGGFENCEGDAVRIEAGNHVIITGAYLSTDGDRSRLIYTSTGFDGELTVTGCYLRGGARGGIWLEEGYANITGNTIINNNEASATSVNVSNCVTSGGKIKVTTSTAHGYETNDMVKIASVTGTTEANGTWIIAVVDTTNFTLEVDANSDTGAASVFTNAYVSGGTSQLATCGVRLLSTAEETNVTGNRFGQGATGTASTEYGVHTAAQDCLAIGNIGYGLVNAVYKSTANHRTSYGRFNVGSNSGSGMFDPYAVDGGLSYIGSGAISTGVKNFQNIAYISGYKIRVIGFTAISSNASTSATDQTSFRLYSNGANLGTANLVHPAADGSNGSTVQHFLLSTPIWVDGTTTPQRLQLNVTSLVGTPDDVVIEFIYQIIQ